MIYFTDIFLLENNFIHMSGVLGFWGFGVLVSLKEAPLCALAHFKAVRESRRASSHPSAKLSFMFRCLRPMPIAHFPGASRARPLSALCAFCLTRNSHTRTSSRCAVFGAIWVCKSPSSISEFILIAVLIAHS